jgi:ribosomal protein S18 acetylase RimI-like enzyme
MTSSPISVRPLDITADIAWAEGLLDKEFAGRLQARRGELVDVLAAPGLVAERGSEVIGLATYDLGDECELAVLVAVRRSHGVGTALLEALREMARPRPIWVVTTNDNLTALRFYQRRGFRLRELRPGAVDDARRALKPAIGRTGESGIPIRDELELVLDTA